MSGISIDKAEVCTYALDVVLSVTLLFLAFIFFSLLLSLTSSNCFYIAPGAHARGRRIWRVHRSLYRHVVLTGSTA